MDMEIRPDEMLNLSEITEKELAVKLDNAINGNAKYQLQYTDYDSDTWTVPLLLNHKRAKIILQDGSISKVKITYCWD